tara:strand:+ start:163 stop:516 length:354 start_codon:yes stop_codon:yes gene_type:complete
MRQETQKIMSAFLRGQPASAQRTNTDGNTVWLHGNKIAHRQQDTYDHGLVQFTLAGWPTVTTRERINGMLDTFGYSEFGISQRNHEQWLVHKGKKVREVGDYEIVSLAELDNLRVSV